MVYVVGDRIGDALLKMPGIRALRAAFPGHRVVWIAGRRASAFKGPLAPLAHGFIDEVRECAGLGLSVRELLRAHDAGHDVVLDTQSRLVTTMVLRRIPHRLFISPAAGFRFSDRRPPPGAASPISVRRGFHTLVELAAGRDLPFETTVAVGPAYHAAAARLLPGGPRYVGFAPGAGGRAKCWPLERFLFVARMQVRAGRVPVFFLGPQERDWLPGIAAAVPEARFPEQEYQGESAGPLLGIALAGRLAAAVANDAGGGHILAASGIPVLTLFGRTNPAKFAGDAPNRIVLSARTFGARTVAGIPAEVVTKHLDATLAGVRQS
jgi:ADP-heptose:LPS heptosyltransferase